MYVNQTALVNFSGSDNKIVRKVPLITNNTVKGCDLAFGVRGDLRRDSKDSIYVAVSGSKGFDKWVDTLFCITGKRTVSITDTLRGYMPYQPHRIYPIEYNEQLLTRNLGFKEYELTDHLGNVRVVVGDAKVPTVSGGTILQSAARIMAYNNFYAFGMTQPGRAYNAGAYRYGFNGKEKDDEIKGGGNSYDFGARIYDPRIARWLSVDPLEKKYPGITTYNFGLNNPIIFDDPDGADGRLTIVKNEQGGGTITLETTVHIYGVNASEDLAKSLTTSFAMLGSTGRQFKDENGKIWTVNIKADFVYDQSLKSMVDATTGPRASDSFGRADNLSASQKESINFKEGDNILEFDSNIDLGDVAGFTVQGYEGGLMGKANFEKDGSITSSKLSIHEVFHMLGYDERYYQNYGIMHKGFTTSDIMTPGTDTPNTVHPIHFTNLVKFALKQTQGYSVQKNHYIDNTCNGNCPSSYEDLSKARDSEIKKK